MNIKNRESSNTYILFIYISINNIILFPYFWYVKTIGDMDVLGVKQRHRNMASVRPKDTKPELIVRHNLCEHGFCHFFPTTQKTIIYQQKHAD